MQRINIPEHFAQRIFNSTLTQQKPCCGICSEHVNNFADAMITPCYHIFHIYCTSLYKKTICPSCLEPTLKISTSRYRDHCHDRSPAIGSSGQEGIPIGLNNTFINWPSVYVYKNVTHLYIPFKEKFIYEINEPIRARYINKNKILELHVDGIYSIARQQETIEALNNFKYLITDELNNNLVGLNIEIKFNFINSSIIKVFNGKKKQILEHKSGKPIEREFFNIREGLKIEICGVHLDIKDEKVIGLIKIETPDIIFAVNL